MKRTPEQKFKRLYEHKANLCALSRAEMSCSTELNYQLELHAGFQITDLRQPCANKEF